MILVLGAFDGFHKGHQELFRRASLLAKSEGCRWSVLTFSPHPQVLFSHDGFSRLFSETERRQIACLLDVDGLREIPFTRALADAPPEAFLEGLVRDFPVRGIVVGADFRFGRARSGDANLLRQEAARRGWRLEVVEQLRLDGAVVSSTRVRHLVQGGDMRDVERLLGYPFFVQGHVVCGDKRGREMGFPTANLALHPGKLLPPNGVYAAAVCAEGALWAGAVNVGHNPTFEGKRSLRFEAHLLDYSGDLYGNCVSVFLLRRLREEKRFPSVGELVAQMEKDKNHARLEYSSWHSGRLDLSAKVIGCFFREKRGGEGMFCRADIAAVSESVVS